MKNNSQLFVMTLCLFLFLFPSVKAQTGIYVPSMQTSDNLINQFLNTYQIQGATVAIARNGKLVYMRAFGHSDTPDQELTQPYNLFRIASLSKPVTSVAIMKLWEQGLINFDDHVFGPAGLLNGDPYFSGANITDTRIYHITIRNLLEHSAGWNSDIPMTPNPLPPYPYGYASSDPIGFPLHVTLTLGESNPVTERALIKFLLQRGLDVAPGTEYHYSNIGFLILGVVIEHLTGMSYEDYVKTQILDPIGAYDMHLCKNLLQDKMEREAEYISNYTNLSCYGTGQYVPLQYGGMNFEAMDAHGGWVASARDLLRLILAVDRFNTKPDILTTATIDTMTTPSLTNANYAKGWNVNQYNNWWHVGNFAGSTAELVRAANGFTWVIILNDVGGGNFFSDLDNLIWNCISSTSTYPGFDLLDTPMENSSNMSFHNVTTSSVTINWDNGDGDKRLLLMKAGNAISKFPLDGTDYTANSSFGSGDNLGDGSYVVYSGNGNSVTVSNLDSNLTYNLRLIEYNNNSATGNYSLYLLANNLEASVNLSATNVEENQIGNLEFNLSQNYPNPFNPSTKIHYTIPELKGSNEIVTLKIYDVLGNEVKTLVNKEQPAGQYEVEFNATSLSSGMYFFKLESGSFTETKKMILLK
ncbi:MAG: serine hydrolase [Ignavibacteriota bacterium]